MERKQAPRKYSRSGGDKVTDKREELLISDINLGFTFVAVALTSYTAGNTSQARKAAKDARKKLHAAQKQLATIEMGRHERRKATDRLKNLQQVLTSIEAKDPGVLSSHPSAVPVRKEKPARVPGGSRNHKKRGGPLRPAYQEDIP
jgi:hypothetical protein